MPRDLQSHIWVTGLLRRVQGAGCMAIVARKGDEARGDILLRVLTLDGKASLYGSTTTLDGEACFEPIASSIPEEEAERIAARRGEEDPDLWIVDIEDRLGRCFLTERVLEE